MMRLVRQFTNMTLGLMWITSLACASETTPMSVSFRSDVAPILIDNCLACHSAKKAEGGYRVDSFQALRQPGDSGLSPLAIPGQVSELLRRMTCVDASERMPAESEPLTEVQIQLIQRWLEAGGKFDGDDEAQTLTLVVTDVHYPQPPDKYPHAVPISAATFSPDCEQLVTSGYHELLVWSTENNAQLVRRITNVGQRVYAVAFSADGQTLAVGGGEPGKSGEVRLIDYPSGAIKAVVSRTNDVVLDLAYHPIENVLAIGAADSTIRLVDGGTFETIQTIASHADWVTAVAWSEDGTRLASASRDKSVKIHERTSGQLIASYLGHGAAVRGVSILADNQQVVSVGADNKLHRWNVDGAKKISELSLAGEGYHLIRNGERLFVPCSDRRLLQIDLTKNTIVNEFLGHQDWVLTACYRSGADGDTGQELLASGAFDGEVRLWNTADRTARCSWVAKP
ncbi:MAG: hypothetical protein KDB22_13580 [Planctomycetales bacterium]|nr:hypothetical protein [Planctomycetales bacterium]